MPQNSLGIADYSYKPLYFNGKEYTDYSRNANLYSRKRQENFDNEMISFNTNTRTSYNNLNIGKRYQPKEKQVIKFVDPNINTYHKFQTSKTVRNSVQEFKSGNINHNNMNNSGSKGDYSFQINEFNLHKPRNPEQKYYSMEHSKKQSLADNNINVNSSTSNIKHPLNKEITVLKDKIHKLEKELHSGTKTTFSSLSSQNIDSEKDLSSPNKNNLYSTSARELTLIKQLAEIQNEKNELAKENTRLQNENAKLKNKLQSFLNTNTILQQEKLNKVESAFNIHPLNKSISFRDEFSNKTNNLFHYENSEQLIQVIEKENAVLENIIDTLENQMNIFLNENQK